MKKLFYNAKFYALEAQIEIYNAMLVENDKILDLYQEIPSFDCERIDLKEACVLPGFTDTHTHSFEGGLYNKGVDLSKAETIKDVLDLLAHAQPISGMIFAWQYDENNIKEKRFPNYEELSKTIPQYPLLLRRIDGHSCAINKKACECIGFEKKLAEDPKSVLKGYANDHVAHWFHQNLDNQAIIDSYQNACQIAMQNGLTGIHTMIGDAQNSYLHFPLIFNNLDSFPINIIPYPQSFNIDQALNIGSKRIGGCILADGSFGSHTAALFEPYYDQPNNYGVPYQSQEFWDQFILNAHLNDLQTGVHCIGDFAIEQLISAIEKAQNTVFKDLRHQIIHCELLNEEQIEKMASLNISAVMQPMFDRLWGGPDGYYSKVLGAERTKRTTRLKSLIDKNILVTGGSDWYITELNPLKGIHASVNIHYKPERLSVFEAIKLFTSNASCLSFEEKTKGILKKGYFADFVCLNEDIFNSESIDNILVDQVYYKGKNVFKR